MKIKRVLAIALCFMLVCFAFTFAGCDKNKKYTVNVIPNNYALGSVSVSPAQSQHKHGSTVTINADASEGCEFVNWIDGNSGEVVSITPSYQFKISSNRIFSANFRKKINASFNLNGGKTASGASSIASITNVPLGNLSLQRLTKNGHIFKGWKVNNSMYSVPENAEDDYAYLVTLNEVNDLNFEAVFEAKTYVPVLNVKDNNGDVTNINANGTYKLTFGQTIPTLPEISDEDKHYDWKLNGQNVVYSKWDKDLEDSSIVFETDVLDAKTFKFKVGKETTATNYSYKVVDKMGAVDIAENIIPHSALMQEGKELLGFVASGTKSPIYTKIQFSENVANDDVTYANKNGSEYIIYEPIYKANTYTVNFDKNSLIYATIEAKDNAALEVEFEKSFTFTVTPKQQAGSEKVYKIKEVYYVDAANKKTTLHETAQGSGEYTIANMPSSNITIKVDAIANYTVKFYDNGKVGEVDLEENATTINVPTLEQKLTQICLGWTTDESDIAPEISIDGKILNVNEFWAKNFTNYTIDLYACWPGVEDNVTAKFVNDSANDISIFAYNSVDKTHSLNFYKDYDLYTALSIFVKQATQTPETEAVTSDKLFAYNLSKIYSEANGIVIQDSTWVSGLYLINANGDKITNKDATITISIKDANENVIASNVGGGIDAETLKTIKGNCTISIIVKTN